MQADSGREQGKTADHENEAYYAYPDSSGWKRAFNERFGFSFDIPPQWEAVEKSNNGDGYFIETGNRSTDLRVYGEDISGNPLTVQMEMQSCDKTEKFSYANGYPGMRCEEDSDVYYYYDTPKSRVAFYVHAPRTWQARNAETLQRIAKSLRVNESGYE